MISVELVGSECHYVEATAALWFLERNNSPESQPLISGKDRQVNYINAFGAEVAFCKLHNLFPNAAIDGFEVWDCLMHDGKKMNVKQTISMDHNLLIARKINLDYADYYSLMIGTFPQYLFAGWVESRSVIQDRWLASYLPKPAYLFPKGGLHQWLYDGSY
jgi:hypothetical protein